MIITDNKQRETLHAAGKRLRFVLDEVSKQAISGKNVEELEVLAQKLIKESGDVPSFFNYKAEGMKYPFPTALCVSINDQMVHGVPGGRYKKIKEGDIVSIDCGLIRDGFYVDAAVSVIAGEGNEKIKKLVDATRRALQDALIQARAGNRTGDIGNAVEIVAKEEGYLIPAELGGHGVGAAVHEDPFIPNMGDPGKGELLVDGQVIAIEPIFIDGDYCQIELDIDNFGLKTIDGSNAAHFEHTIIITKGAPEIVTGPMW